jgi:hypothetical protein
MTRTDLPILVLLAFAWIALARPASAADSVTRSVARDLGTEGVEAYQQGHYEEAVDKLGKAFRILQAPALGLWSARALVKCGKLVEASERYLEASRAEISAGGDQAVQASAQAEALAERDALLPRIPKLVVHVAETTAEPYEVTINGVAVAPELLDTSMPVDPGQIIVVLSQGRQVTERSVVLEEGGLQTVTLDLTSSLEPVGPSAAASIAAIEAAPPPPPPAQPSPVASPPADRSSAKKGVNKTQRTIGFITLGAGALGLAAGGVTGGVALAMYQGLDCDQSGVCSDSTPDRDIQTVNTLRMVSLGALVAGGVLAVTGTTLVLTARRRESPAVGFYTDGTTVGLTGTF